MDERAMNDPVRNPGNALEVMRGFLRDIRVAVERAEAQLAAQDSRPEPPPPASTRTEPAGRDEGSNSSEPSPLEAAVQAARGVVTGDSFVPPPRATANATNIPNPLSKLVDDLLIQAGVCVDLVDVATWGETKWDVARAWLDQGAKPENRPAFLPEIEEAIAKIDLPDAPQVALAQTRSENLRSAFDVAPELPAHVVPELGEHPSVTEEEKRKRLIACAYAEKVLTNETLDLNEAWIELQYKAPAGWFKSKGAEPANQEPAKKQVDLLGLLRANVSASKNAGEIAAKAASAPPPEKKKRGRPRKEETPAPAPPPPAQAQMDWIEASERWSGSAD
jgi:hypothetical protein